ncbi:MAG: hypothetical protein GX871_00830 [Microbacteriaceae bacterium]|nr:hypothetical protein [Microbacteriaceae bacterium]
MSDDRGIRWASSILIWVWSAGIAVAAFVGVFFGTSSGNLMIGLTWGIALTIAWVAVFAMVRAQRRKGARTQLAERGVDTDDEPSVLAAGEAAAQDDRPAS